MIISELPVVRAFRLEKFLIAADWVARPGKERTPNQTSQELTKEMVKIRKILLQKNRIRQLTKVFVRYPNVEMSDFDQF